MARFENLKQNKPSLLSKMFSTQELDYVKSKINAQSLTGIWCAKEATVKAFSLIKIIDIRSVYIAHYPNGAPFVSQIVNFDFEEYYQMLPSMEEIAASLAEKEHVKIMPTGQWRCYVY